MSVVLYSKRTLTDSQQDLVARNWEHLLHIARDHAKPGTPWEEIYDATVETAITTASTYRKEMGSYGGFFAFCIQRTLFRYYRERAELCVSLTDDIAVAPEPPYLDFQELASKGMTALRGRQRRVIYWTFYRGLSEAEIGKKLKCTKQNVHKIKHLALAKMRRRLGRLL